MAQSILAGLVALCLCGCGGAPGAAPDACGTDAACSVPPDACQLDATCGRVDAPIDGPIAVSCPQRTRPAGVPERDYAASEIHLGDVTVTSAVEVTALAGIKVLSGSLTIASPIDTVLLPDLEVITEDLVTTSTTIAAIELPRLETVGGRVDARVDPSSGPLARWSTPRLESVGTLLGLVTRDLELGCLVSAPVSVGLSRVQHAIVLPRFADTATASFQAVATSSIELPVFRGGTLQVFSCPLLTTLRVAGPRTLDLRMDPVLSSITLEANAATRFVELDGLHELGTLDFLASAPALAALAVRGAAVLHSVAGAAQPDLADLTITDAPVLTTLGALGKSRITGDLVFERTGVTAIDFPDVVDLRSRIIGVLSIRNNEALTTLSLPALAALGATDHFITGNVRLPTAQATAIRDQVKLDPGGTLTIQNNLP